MSHTQKSARELAINSLRNSIPSNIWKDNEDKITDLKLRILKHPLFQHDIISLLKNKSFNLIQIQKIHLEYEHSIVEIFTDALLMAQFQAKQLDSYLYPTMKMLPRFLIAFNINDEFGLVSEHNNYENTPLNSHFCLFNKVLADLGISTNKQRQEYIYSSEAINLKVFLENTYRNYIKVIVALAIAEQQVITFSPPLKQAVKDLGIDVECGYYDVHGTTADQTTAAADDLHEEDLWLLLNHALHVFSFHDVESIAFQYCDLWNSFWNKMKEI